MPDDRAAIEAACTDYAASWLEGDRDRMASCLHPGLAKRTPRAGASGSLELDDLTYDDMVASAARGPRAYSRDVDVAVHHIDGGIASASVRTEPWLDFLHLAWFGDRWLLVNALYEPRSPSQDDPSNRAAIAALLDAYVVAAFDDDAEAILRTHHPALAERRVVAGESGAPALEDSTRGEVVEEVARGLDMRRFRRTWESRVLEVGRGIAAGKVVAGWYDVDLHLARFGIGWQIVNILYRVLPAAP